MYAEIAALKGDVSSNRTISLSDSTLVNQIRFYFPINIQNKIISRVDVGGSTIYVFDYNITTSETPIKLAFRYSSNGMDFYVNGTLVSSSPLSPSFTNNLNSLQFRRGDGASGEDFYGKNKALAVYKEALTDANLRCLTYPNPVATTFDLDFDTIAEQFTFTRGSEATFVNEQGLIESTNQIGPELVTNGDFATDSDWTKLGSWTIENGKLTTSGGASLVYQNISSSVNKTYKITFEVSDYVSGEVTVGTGAALINPRGEYVSANGVYTQYLTKTDTNQSFGIKPNNFIGSIDNISVKEVISATNTPRIDYSTGEKAFLLEPQSTNLIPYSEDFSQWYNVSATLTPNQLSPDGQNSAYIIEDSSVNIFERIDKTITTNATPHTFSVFIKKKTSAVSSYSGIQMGTGFSYVIFDSYNGTYNTSLNTNYDSIEVVDFNSDWWVLKLTATVTTSTRVGLWGAISEDGINISI